MHIYKHHNSLIYSQAALPCRRFKQSPPFTFSVKEKEISHLKFSFSKRFQKGLFVAWCKPTSNAHRCAVGHVRHSMSRTLLLTRLRWRREQFLSRGGVNWESIRRGEPTALLPHTHPRPHKEVPGQQRRITRGGVDNGTSCPAQKGYGQLRPSNGIHTCTFAFLFLKKKTFNLG